LSNFQQKISVARIIKTQGNRGEVAADVLTDFPTRFKHLSAITLEREGDPVLALNLDSHWFHKRRVILKFRGVDTISSAERLIGYDVKIHPGELMPLAEGSYYQHDLIGCRLQSPAGLPYGTVVEVLGNAGAYLLKVQREHGDFLVPFAESYFRRIDIPNKVLICDLPEGLDEL
jgi:16S rRNA processing protein RimM